jgi:thioredoxin reductase
MNIDHEALIIGGGPAGLSAAMTLGRISRSALVADDGQPRNAPSSHLNNFPTRDGIHPREWLKLARRDLDKYATIRRFDGRVVSAERTSGGFRAKLSSGAEVSVKKIILAYGIQDKMPPIPGFRELWGKSIFHCPFCHGFEIRGARIGFLISNETAFHPLPMIHSLSPDLVLFTNGKVKLSDEQRRLLDRRNIVLIEDEVSRIHHDGESLRSVELADGKRIERQYLFYNPELPFDLKSDIGNSLGCRKTPFGLYEVNEFGATSVEGAFAAGDNMAMGHSVLLAAASGVRAGTATIAQLLSEE